MCTNKHAQHVNLLTANNELEVHILSCKVSKSVFVVFGAANIAISKLKQ